MKKTIDESKLSRIEVINHSSNKDLGSGRIFTHWDMKNKTKITLEIQDNEKTMKIFIDDKQND